MLQAAANPRGRHHICLPVIDPERYGVVEFDQSFNAISIEENLPTPKAIMRCRVYIFITTMWSASPKTFNQALAGEYEITDVNWEYLQNKN